ncbi:hypothetical protein Micbo1qcDRAFT_166078, partial [Microdochium bolleyi]
MAWLERDANAGEIVLCSGRTSCRTPHQPDKTETKKDKRKKGKVIAALKKSPCTFEDGSAIAPLE